MRDRKRMRKRTTVKVLQSERKHAHAIAMYTPDGVDLLRYSSSLFSVSFFLAASIFDRLLERL